LVLRSPAKLNLYLRVKSRRRDNYHNITTLFERIALFDELIFKARPDGKIKISCNNRALSTGRGNLVYQAAALLQKKFTVSKGADIRIVKRIPIGAGLGGGSSNAAYALLGLNRLWGLKLKKGKLLGFARALGSDVAFFLHDCPFARGEGRGEKIACLKALNKVKLWHVLVAPKFHVSTPLIYRKWDKFAGSFKLTTPKADVKILTSALKKRDLSEISAQLYNDLETFREYPAVARIKEELAVSGLRGILMSGSGPAIFAMVSSRKEAVSLAGRLRRQPGSGEVFAVRTF